MKIGYDVEAFLKAGPALVPACDYIKGSKSEPFQADGFNMHPDNIMAEFSCTTPVEVDDLLDHIIAGRERISASLPDGVVMEFCGSADASSLVDHPSMLELGCDPDQVGDEIRTLGIDQLGTQRGAGFHLHFDTDLPSTMAAAICDTILGITSVALGENQGHRRTTYGTAGAHRVKPYGIEYRMLSSDFVNVMSADWNEVRGAIKATAAMLSNPQTYIDLMILSDDPASGVADIINNDDRGAALQLYNDMILPIIMEAADG